MPAGFVKASLEDSQLKVESNLSNTEQIAILEAAKFQIIARNSGMVPNTIRAIADDTGAPTLESKLVNLPVRHVGGFNR